MVAVTFEVAVSIRQVLSSVRVTLSLAFSWEVTKEPVLVRTPVFYCVLLCFTVHIHILKEQLYLPPRTLFLHSLSFVLLFLHSPFFSASSLLLLPPFFPMSPLLVCLRTTLSIRCQRVRTRHRQLPATV